MNLKNLSLLEKVLLYVVLPIVAVFAGCMICLAGSSIGNRQAAPPASEPALPLAPTSAPARALPTPRPAAPPTVEPPPVAPRPASQCDCSRDAYNCDDAQANECFSYCLSTGAGDVHKLDRDGDGAACESN